MSAICRKPLDANATNVVNLKLLGKPIDARFKPQLS
jgi:hypothetical protein